MLMQVVRMIKVEANVYAALRKYHRGVSSGKPLRVEVSEGTTVAGLLQQMGIPREEVQLVFVNNVQQYLSYILQPGDRLGIFPVIAGG